MWRIVLYAMTKKCKACGIEKEADRFETTTTVSKGRPYQHVRLVCKDCINAKRVERDRSKTALCKSLLPVEEFTENGIAIAICRRCKVPKPKATEFRAGRRICKGCEYDVHTRWGRSHLTAVMIQSAKFRAKRDGVPFNITNEDVVIPALCPVFGKPLAQGNRQSHEWAPTLDRIKPELGYVRGNVQVMSHKANWLKNNASVEELQRIVEWLIRLHSQ
jgi:hypothetical protein